MREILSEYGRTILTGFCVTISIGIIIFALAGTANLANSALKGAIGTEQTP